MDSNSDTRLVLPQRVEAELAHAGSANGILGSLSQVDARLQHREGLRKRILAYVEKNFLEGVDYGLPFPNSPKKVLLKPGAEKIFSLLGLRAQWSRDMETWEMLGKKEGVICYVCRLVEPETDRVFGEGRGVAKVGEKSRDENSAAKIAEKRAMVDAVLYAFGLSEIFTQDEEQLKNDKRTFRNEVQQWLQQHDSPLTAVQFVRKVAQETLGRSFIKTAGELNEIRRLILGGAFDPRTGDKFPSSRKPSDT